MCGKQPMFKVPLQAMGPIRLWSTWDPEQFDLTKHIPEFVRDMPKAYAPNAHGTSSVCAKSCEEQTRGNRGSGTNLPGHAPSMPSKEPRSPLGTPGGFDVLVASVGASAAGGVRGTQNGQGGRTESVYDNSQEL